MGGYRFSRHALLYDAATVVEHPEGDLGDLAQVIFDLFVATLSSLQVSLFGYISCRRRSCYFGAIVSPCGYVMVFSVRLYWLPDDGFRISLNAGLECTELEDTLHAPEDTATLRSR